MLHYLKKAGRYDMEHLFEYYIQNDDFHFKYAKGEPSVKNREFHNYHEFVFFMEGEAYFISKNIQQELLPGSLILIPQDAFHQFCVTNPCKYKRCILGFHATPEILSLIDEIMTEVKIVLMPAKRILRLWESIIETVTGDLSEEIKQLFIRASLIQMLVYMKQGLTGEITQNLNISPLVQQALSYIDLHYTQKITVESIAGQLYVSPSTLAHHFKKELNIPIYQYISKKRILSVHKLVEAGESYAKAAVDSGFNDYSCFYRIYKKYL